VSDTVAERRAAEVFGKWLVYERVDAGGYNAHDFARTLECRSSEVCSAERGCSFCLGIRAHQAQLWPSEAYLGRYVKVRDDLSEQLVVLRDHMARQPEGRVVETYRRRLQALVRRESNLELHFRDDVASLLTESGKSRGETQHNRFYWQRLFPLLLIATFVTPAAASGALLRRATSRDLLYHPALLASTALLLEVLAVSLAFGTDRVFYKTAAMIRRSWPLRGVECELDRLAMPGTRTGKSVTYYYLEPLTVRRLLEALALLDTQARYAAAYGVTAIVTFVITAVHGSWQIVWYPALWLAATVVAICLIYVQTRDLVHNVARGLARRIEEAKL